MFSHLSNCHLFEDAGSASGLEQCGGLLPSLSLSLELLSVSESEPEVLSESLEELLPPLLLLLPLLDGAEPLQLVCWTTELSAGARRTDLWAACCSPSSSSLLSLRSSSRVEVFEVPLSGLSGSASAFFGLLCPEDTSCESLFGNGNLLGSTLAGA